jgi:putative transposase
MTTSLENKNTGFGTVWEVLAQQGVEGFRPVIEWFWNALMQAERSEALKAEPYERTSERAGYANGFKPKTLQTRIGTLELQVPQVRGMTFYPQCLEKGSRSEVALKLAVAEMYVQGVTTRRVTKVMEELCGLEVTSAQVSRVAQGLDEQLAAFRGRMLGAYRFVILDARYEKVRVNGTVIDSAVLTAIGINGRGYREILGVSVALSEAEVHWKNFLSDLQRRGLQGTELFVSDDHAGLKAARKAVFPSVPWQRCQFHLAQNAQAYAPKITMRPGIAQAMRDIFNAPSYNEAKRQVALVVERYEKSAPEFVQWLENNIEEGLTVFSLPRGLWKKLRTSNMIENLNREIRRRTRLANLFPNTESCLRLVTAVLQEIHEDWITGKKYIDLEKIEEQSDLIYRKKVA